MTGYEIVTIVSAASDAENEDRGGAAGAYAWVIDGATDVIEAPLTPGVTDASWVAATLDRLLGEVARAAQPPFGSLAGAPGWLSERLAEEFGRVVRRVPEGRHEHPSASGVIVRIEGPRLHYVGVGDCTLLAETRDGFRRLVTHERDAGDPWVAQAVAAFHAGRQETTPQEARAHLWPRIRAGRAMMNQPDGYGVLSVTPTPARFVTAGSIEPAAGGHVLLASDGLMRLADVYRRYTAEELLAASRRDLDAVVAELRAIERDDAGCRRFPRAKASDDATGVLLRF